MTVELSPTRSLLAMAARPKARGNNKAATT